MTAICNNDYDHSEVSPCSHEEADTRVFVHTKDASSSHEWIAIWTADTDVLAIDIAMFPELDLEELWCDFGNGKHRVPASARDISQFRRKEIESFAILSCIFRLRSSFFPRTKKMSTGHYPYSKDKHHCSLALQPTVWISINVEGSCL